MERDIQKEIREKLREIEEKEQVFILLAVKTGLGRRGAPPAECRSAGSLLKRSCAARSSLADQMEDDRNNNWEALNCVFLELLKEEQRQAG